MMNKLFKYHTDVYASSIKGYCLLSLIFIHLWLEGIQRFGFSQLDPWFPPEPYHVCEGNHSTYSLRIVWLGSLSSRSLRTSKHGLKTLPENTCLCHFLRRYFKSLHQRLIKASYWNTDYWAIKNFILITTPRVSELFNVILKFKLKDRRDEKKERESLQFSFLFLQHRQFHP